MLSSVENDLAKANTLDGNKFQKRGQKVDPLEIKVVPPEGPVLVPLAPSLWQIC